jgi:hypothetical protein
MAQTTQPADNPVLAPSMPAYAVKIDMKPAQMARLAQVMHSGHSYCFLEDLDPGDDSSMLLICLPNPPPTSTFSP